MTSATLFREGYDLDEVIAELEDRYPGQVRVVDVTYGREGGVAGFFARRTVGVRYRLEDEPVAGSSVDHAETHTDPLEELMRAADAAEMVESGQAPKHVADTEGNVEFARMLLEMAAAKRQAALDSAKADEVVDEPIAAEPVVTPVVAPPVVSAAPPVPTIAPVAAAPVVAAPIAPPAPPVPPVRVAAPVAPMPPAPPAPRPIAPPIPTPPPSPAAPLTPAAWARPVIPPEYAYTPAGPIVPEEKPAPRRRPVGAHRAAEHDPRYALRRQLTELGVPLSWIPDEGDPYRVLEDLTAYLPDAAPLALGPGQVLAIPGAPGDAAQVAEWVRTALRLDASCVHTVGQLWQAEQLAARVRFERSAPAIVIVETDTAFDRGYPANQLAAELVRALAPDLVWQAVDASQKPSDVRARAAALGNVDALALFGAATTTSPASVWELDLPVVLIDGRWATRGAWLALLLDKLAALAD